MSPLEVDAQTLYMDLQGAPTAPDLLQGCVPYLLFKPTLSLLCVLIGGSSILMHRMSVMRCVRMHRPPKGLLQGLIYCKTVYLMFNLHCPCLTWAFGLV